MANIIKDEFTSNDNKNYKVKLGKTIASSLAGFIAGAICVLIIMFTLFELKQK